MFTSLPTLEMYTVENRMVIKIIVWQIILVFCISFILGWVFTYKTGLSFTFGGLISILPGWLFARIFFKNIGVQAPQKIIHSFFYGEAIKWLITIGLFVLVFQWKSLQIFPLFAGIITAQLVYWLAFIK